MENQEQVQQNDEAQPALDQQVAAQQPEISALSVAVETPSKAVINISVRPHPTFSHFSAVAPKPWARW
jgi:hypothetical protein